MEFKYVLCRSAVSKAPFDIKMREGWILYALSEFSPWQSLYYWQKSYVWQKFSGDFYGALSRISGLPADPGPPLNMIVYPALLETCTKILAPERSRYRYIGS